jgi:predicted O-linked N-acetylglucosamine transferase (SPINDLY family)
MLTKLKDATSLEEYWQIGVDKIVSGSLEEAQAAWMIPFLNEDHSEEQLNKSLTDYLLAAMHSYMIQQEMDMAYAIVKCLQILSLGDVNMSLQFLSLSIDVNKFDISMLVGTSFIEVLADASITDINLDMLYTVVKKISVYLTLQYADRYLALVQLIVGKISDVNRFICEIAPLSLFLGKQRGLLHLRTQLLQVCLTCGSSDFRFTLLCDLAESTIQERDYQMIISVGEQCYQEGRIIGGISHVSGSHRLLTALMEAGEWQRIPDVAMNHKKILQEFLTQNYCHISDVALIVNSSYYLNYLYDEPKMLHGLRNSVGDICLEAVKLANKSFDWNNNHKLLPKTNALRIGYIASTLNNHSVGWLARWIFKYHDRSNFQIFIYCVGQSDNQQFNRKFFRDKVDVAHYLGTNSFEISELIRRDEIDILIDLDSLSLSVTYEVMCYKPALLSATWLGWDTSGCPEVDYFIADPYVLPADAEEYYQTKIWRLPQTYLAIDGFEIQVPTKRRSDYQIPEEAIVYLCAQKSYKHHPDILRLQMQIIKQVPNSYLLVKMRANPESLMRIYQELADEIGISIDQLRFIQPDPDEMTHRANLQLADVVLDTFPYNGATTTLETLWMGVPMVTKVGQAFVARNSYAFMQQVGVTEGIAHTDAEYVDWGVRLGTDLALRQQVMGKLLHSRKTSPLWNARSFTLEMENAYRQMWEIYQSQVLAQQK